MFLLDGTVDAGWSLKRNNVFKRCKNCHGWLERDRIRETKLRKWEIQIKKNWKRAWRGKQWRDHSPNTSIHPFFSLSFSIPQSLRPTDRNTLTETCSPWSSSLSSCCLKHFIELLNREYIWQMESTDWTLVYIHIQTHCVYSGKSKYKSVPSPCTDQ